MSNNDRPTGLPQPTYGIPPGYLNGRTLPTGTSNRPQSSSQNARQSGMRVNPAPNGWSAPSKLFNRPPQPLQSRVILEQQQAPRLAQVGYQQPSQPHNEERLTSGEAQKQLNDLVQGVNADFADVDLSQAQDNKVDGMSDLTLLKHQITGIAWMKDRESGMKNKYGGILADDVRG